MHPLMGLEHPVIGRIFAFTPVFAVILVGIGLIFLGEYLGGVLAVVFGAFLIGVLSHLFSRRSKPSNEQEIRS